MQKVTTWVVPNFSVSDRHQTKTKKSQTRCADVESSVSVLVSAAPCGGGSGAVAAGGGAAPSPESRFENGGLVVPPKPPSAEVERPRPGELIEKRFAVHFLRPADGSPPLVEAAASIGDSSLDATLSALAPLTAKPVTACLLAYEDDAAAAWASLPFFKATIEEDDTLSRVVVHPGGRRRSPATTAAFTRFILCVGSRRRRRRHRRRMLARPHVRRRAAAVRGPR